MNLSKQILITLSLLLISMCSFAQIESLEQLREKHKDVYILSKPNEEIRLDTIHLLPRPKFKTNYSRRYYYWLRKKTFKAYPYAVLTKEKLKSINDTLQRISSSRKKKRFIKEKQRFFEEKFEKDIKKLTKTEGRILIKLIHRLTGETVDTHIRDKRGKFKAFWYRVSASLFKIKLNLEYHPEFEMEDYMIESILQNAFFEGELAEEPSVLKEGNIPLLFKVIAVDKNK